MLAQIRLSLVRMAEFLDAEEAPPAFEVEESDVGVTIEADFAWEAAVEEAGRDFAASKPKTPGRFARRRARKALEKAEGNPKDTEEQEQEQEKEKDADAETITEAPDIKAKDATPFALRDIKMQIKKGEFVAIVGRVASGTLCAANEGHKLTVFDAQAKRVCCRLWLEVRLCWLTAGCGTEIDSQR